MKNNKLIYLFFNLIFATPLVAQIGINTENPLHIFHIDGKGDTSSGGAGNILADDVVITNDGQVGIGTANIAPGYKLDVRGNALFKGNKTIDKGDELIGGNAFVKKVGIGTTSPKGVLHIAKFSDVHKLKISDSSQQSGHILTCDENGYAYWDGLRPVSSVVHGELTEGVTIKPSETDVNITKNDLLLSPGRWMIIAKAVTLGDLGGFYMYIKLFRKDLRPGSNFEFDDVLIATSGASAGIVSPYISVPNLIGFVNIPRRSGAKPGTFEFFTRYCIKLNSTSINGKTTHDYGGVEFYAIRIDREP